MKTEIRLERFQAQTKREIPGEDDEWLIPAVRIFDVRTGREDSWFAGPRGSLVFDEHLFSFDKDDGMGVWDVATGERLLIEPELCPEGYNRAGRQFLSILEDNSVQISRLVSGIGNVDCGS